MENVIGTFLAWFSLENGSCKHTSFQACSQVTFKSASWFQPNVRGLGTLQVVLDLLETDSWTDAVDTG